MSWILIGIIILLSVGFIVWKVLNQTELEPPILDVIDFKQDLNEKQREKFNLINKAALSLGFYTQLDFQMTWAESKAPSYGQIYLHSETMTILAARCSDFFWGQSKVFDFYSTFSDGTRLITTNSKKLKSRTPLSSVLVQSAPRTGSLEQCFEQHKNRLYHEATGGREVIYNKHQPFFSTIKEIYGFPVEPSKA